MCRMFKIRVPDSLQDPDRTVASDAARQAIASAIEARMKKSGTAVFEFLIEPRPRATTGIEIRCIDEGTRDTDLIEEAITDAVKAIHDGLGGRFSVRGSIAGREHPVLELKGTSAAA